MNVYGVWIVVLAGVSCMGASFGVLVKCVVKGQMH